MEILNIFFYIILFAMGITFGSFYTLALYRIPKRQDITHTHSYCPNCNHKLGFLDLIPVFSYIFLGAKCKYCKNKTKIFHSRNSFWLTICFIWIFTKFKHI